MANFEDRERAFEKEFERNRELAFKVSARRNNLFGLWAARCMGLMRNAATDYAMEIVDLGATAGDDVIIDRVLGDLVTSGYQVDAEQLRAKLLALAAEARAQLAHAAGEAPP